jgi:uncharacterized protein involved in response to NO
VGTFSSQIGNIAMITIADVVIVLIQISFFSIVSLFIQRWLIRKGYIRDNKRDVQNVISVILLVIVARIFHVSFLLLGLVIVLSMMSFNNTDLQATISKGRWWWLKGENNEEANNEH